MSLFLVEYIMNVLVIGFSSLGYILIFAKLRTRKPFYILNTLVTVWFLWLIDPHVFEGFPEEITSAIPLFIVKVLLVLYCTFYFSLSIAISFRLLKDKRRDKLVGFMKYATIINLVTCIVILSLYVI